MVGLGFAVQGLGFCEAWFRVLGFGVQGWCRILGFRMVAPTVLEGNPSSLKRLGNATRCMITCPAQTFDRSGCPAVRHYFRLLSALPS